MPGGGTWLKRTRDHGRNVLPWALRGIADRMKIRRYGLPRCRGAFARRGAPARRRVRGPWSWLVLLACALGSAAARAAVPTPQEYISGFVLYVRWPGDETIKSWQVCVAAASDAGDKHYAGLSVRERPFEVRHVKSGDALGGCQILDLTASDPATTAALLKSTQGRNGLLTIGNGRDFCSAGGQICLRMAEPHGGFEVNLSAVKNAGFLINAKLLMMARQSDAAGGAP